MSGDMKGEMIVMLSFSKLGEFTSRDMADPICNMIKNELKDKEVIGLDFEYIEVLSPTFAHEFFCQLPTKIIKKLKYYGLSRVKMDIMDEAREEVLKDRKDLEKRGGTHSEAMVFLIDEFKSSGYKFKTIQFYYRNGKVRIRNYEGLIPDPKLKEAK